MQCINFAVKSAFGISRGPHVGPQGVKILIKTDIYELGTQRTRSIAS